jgi:MSHA biogenesis protein MshQ
MRAWLAVLGLAGCTYREPANPAAPGDAQGDGATDTQVVDPDAPDAPAVPWLHPYAHRKRITLLASKIDDTGGALANFPVLIALDDADLGAATQFADMAFTTDDATTLLDSEIERFAGDELVAWVRIPALSATADTAIYLYYGNPAPVQTNPQGVWMQDFFGVWHLSQSPAGGGPMLDSTANARNGTAMGMQAGNLAPAMIGNGLTFDGSNDFINLGTSNVGNAFTVSLWANLATDSANNLNTLVANSGQAFQTNGYRFFINTANTANRRVIFETGNGSAGSTCETDTDAVTAGTPAHIVAVIDRAGGNCQLFVNGALATSGNDDVRTDFATNSDFEFGRLENNAFHFRGVLDEINIATTMRPAGWIVTTFNNQSAPGEFYTVDPEEDAPPAPAR